VYGCCLLLTSFLHGTVPHPTWQMTCRPLDHTSGLWITNGPFRQICFWWKWQSTDFFTPCPSSVFYWWFLTVIMHLVSKSVVKIQNNIISAIVNTTVIFCVCHFAVWTAVEWWCCCNIEHSSPVEAVTDWKIHVPHSWTAELENILQDHSDWVCDIGTLMLCVEAVA